MEPFCNHLALGARAELKAYERKLKRKADRYYLASVVFILCSIPGAEAVSGLLY